MSLLRPLLVIALAALTSQSRAADEAPPADFAHPPERVSAAGLAALPPHPRLLANASRWVELRSQIRTDPESAEIFSLLRMRAERLLALPPVDYAQDPHNILVPVRDAEQRILTLATVYRLTDEPRYLAGIRLVLADLLAQPWPRGHFLDTAEAAFTTSAAFDWLHADLTPAERAKITEKVYREALVSSVTEEERMGWLWADHNWNQVCHGGLVTAAITFAERDPALSARIINRALANLPRAAAAYAPEGIYPEGPTYWNFGTTYHLIQLEAYRAALGDSLGLERFPGFLASAGCLDFLTGPSDLFFNYSDNRAARSYSAASLWFARENHRPDLALAELDRIRRHALNFGPEDTRELPLSLLWWRPLPRPLPSSSLSPLHWRGENIQPLAVLRSAWNDPLASWLAIKGGTANHSHAHMDAGSFVFEALGVRWALDPVRDEYAFLRAAGYRQSEIFNYKPDSKRWAVFRLGPEGHNILRFDGAPQNVDGAATVGPIVASTDGSAAVEVNLDSTYAGQASRVRRTATLRPDASLVLADTWTALDRPASVTWQWLTRAAVTREPDGLRLSQGGRTLLLRITPADARVELQPVDSLLNPRIDSPLPDHTRIVIHVATPACSDGSLTVSLVPLSAEAHTQAASTPSVPRP